MTMQYGTDEQAHKDVMLQLNKKDLFVDPEDTITLQDLDDDFLNAEVDNLVSELMEEWTLGLLSDPLFCS